MELYYLYIICLKLLTKLGNKGLNLHFFVLLTVITEKNLHPGSDDSGLDCDHHFPYNLFLCWIIEIVELRTGED